MKKALSLFLTVIMILSMFSCLTVMTWAATSDLVAGQKYTVASGTTKIFIPKKSGSYQFKSFGYGDPKITINCQNGEYEFDDDNYYDFCGTVDLEAGEEVSCYLYNYDGEDCVFEITEFVVPAVTFTPAKPIEIMENTKGYWDEGFDYDGEWMDFYHYYIPSVCKDGNKFTVEYPDGITEIYTCDDSGDFLNSSGELLNFSTYSDQEAGSRWQLGSDNYFTISVLGASIKVPVTIIENTCVSIEFVPAKPFVIMENTKGYWYEDWLEEKHVFYYSYNVSNLLHTEDNSIVVNFSDGTNEVYFYKTDEGYVNEFGERMDVGYSDNQSEYNPWVIGSDNKFIVRAFGKEVQVPVTIVENPCESIEFIPAKPIKIVENTNGYWETSWEWDDELDNETYVEYYVYEADDLFYTEGNAFIINYKDGTSEAFIYEDGEYVSPLGEVLDCDYSANQYYYERWLLGSDNHFIVEAFGKEIQVPVTIVEAPYASIEFAPVEPIEIMEETNGYWDWDEIWSDDGMDCEEVEYYRYDVYDWFYKEGNTITVNYKDSTSDAYVYCECYNSDEDYYYNAYVNEQGDKLACDYYSNQGYDKQWRVGSENYFIVEAFGKQTLVPVTITANPCESIEFIPAEPFEIIENTNGYWDNDWVWDEDSDDDVLVEYYCYDVDDLFYSEGNKIVVNYTDGTSDVYTYQTHYNEDEDYYYKAFVNESGEVLECAYSSDQWYSNRWLIGSDNYFTVEALSREAKVPVTIIESPYESIEFIPVVPCEITEFTNGYWEDDYYWDDETGKDIPVRYYTYYIDDILYADGNAIAINYKDGTRDVYICHNWDYMNEFGEELSWNSHIDDSYENQWTLGSDNCFTIEALGLTVDVPVTIIESAYASVEYFPVDELCIEQYTNGYWETDGDDEEYFDYYYSKVIKKDGDIIRLTKKNGQVQEYVYSDLFFKDSNGASIEHLSFASNDYEWDVGEENYIIVTANGVSCRLYVTINEASTTIQENRFAAEMISDDECIITDIITGYESVKVIDIPETINGYKVVGIEDGVLGGIYNLDIVNLPSTFSMISENLFYGCENLEEVNVSEENEMFASVNGVFYNKALTEIIFCPEYYKGEFVIKSEVTDIPQQAYIGLNKAKNVVIEEGNSSFVVEDGILYNKDYTTIYTAFSVEGDYVMKDSVEEVAELAFSGLENLESVMFANGVTEISYATFANCTSLKSVELPDSLESIGYAAFIKATALTSIALPESTKSIAGSAFSGCSNLKDVNLNEGLEKLGYGVFWECGIEEIELPVSLTTIADSTFWGCPLKSINIPDSVTKIGEHAFYNTDITSVSIPSSVKTMISAFSNCDKLEEVTFEEGFDGDCRYAFSWCEKLKAVDIPDTVTELSYNQFNGCVSLENIDIPDNLYKVEAFSFSETGWYNNQPDGITYLEHVLFDYKGDMPEDFTATVKAGTKSIAEYAFERESTLVDVKLNDGLKYIGEGAFVDCKKLKGVTIPESVEYIGDYAFGYKYGKYRGAVVRCDDFVICGRAGTAAEQYAKDNGFEFVEIVTPKDFIQVETAGVLCNGEITYTIKLKEGTTISGAIFGAVFDTDVLEPVNEKSGAYTKLDSYGEETTNIPGLYVAGMKSGSDNTYLIGYTGIDDYNCNKDKEFVKLTFRVKDFTATNTAVDFYCVELIGAPSIAKNDFEEIVACCENEIYSYDHTPCDEWKIKKEANAVQSGLKIKDCTVCGEVLETVEMPQTVCDKPVITGIENTDDGLVVSWDKVYGADTYKLFKKRDANWILVATCTDTSYVDENVINNVEYSYAVKACNVVGDSEHSDIVSKVFHRHNLGEWLVKTPATCTEYGESYRKCSGCDYEETEIIEPIGHKYSDVWTVDIAPTCTESGSKSHHCTACGDKKDITVIEATGHNYVWTNNYEDNTKTGKCSVCGAEITEDLIITDIITLTLNSNGTGYTVTDCVSDYPGEIEIPETYNDLPITAIGTDAFRDTLIYSVSIPESVTSIGGSAFRNCINLTNIDLPDNIKTIPGAMCFGCTSLETIIIPDDIISVGGYAFNGCSALKYVFYESDETAWRNITIGANNIPLTDAPVHFNSTGEHNYSTEWTVDIEPTCTKNGSKSHHCTVCDVKTDITDVAIAEHSYGDWIVTIQPTCANEGSRKKVCIHCGDTVTEPIGTVGHSYSTEWTIDVAPTCTETGSKSHHCTVCGDKGDVTLITATGHNYKWLSTEIDHPHTITYKCSFCDDEKIETTVGSGCVECNFTFTTVDSGCYKLVSYIGTEKTVVIPAQYNGRTVTTIANACFRGNNTITSIDIPDSVTSIGSLAFMNCTSLESVIIPESVKTIGAQAFYGFKGTIYCVSGSVAHEYAVANNIKFVLLGIMGTENTTVDYENFIIRTTVQNCADIKSILSVSETAIAVPVASYIYGDIELYGTGTIVAVFDGDDYIGDFTLVVAGDTNGDSVCDALDCVNVERTANSNAQLSGVYTMAADSNYDDVVDISDYQAIVNKALAS